MLERHKPLLRYDSQGSFFADSARMMAERVGGNPPGANCLKRADGSVIAAYLDAVGRDYVLQSRELHGYPHLANRVYGHLAADEKGATWLQYWFFYYFNDKAFLGFGLHEGDWEMVQIGLSANGTPEAMTFAQHEHAERCAWKAVEKHEGERPVVYVARGSQASYSRPGRHRAPIVPDQADGKGATVSTTLEVLDDRRPGWVGWPGRWGSTVARNIAESNSPRGPKQHGQWRKPGEFHADAVEHRELRGSSSARQSYAPRRHRGSTPDATAITPSSTTTSSRSSGARHRRHRSSSAWTPPTTSFHQRPTPSPSRRRRARSSTR